MLKQKLVIEVKRVDRLYSLEIPSGCSLGEVHDVIFEMKQFVLDQMNQVHMAEKTKEQPQQAPVESVQG